MLGIGVDGPLAGSIVATPVDARRDSDSGTPLAPSVSAEAEHDAWTVLAGVHGLGPVGFATLLRRYGSASAILHEATAPGGPARLASRAAHDALPDASPPDGAVEDRAADRAIGPAVAEAIADAAATAERTLARVRRLGLSVVTIRDADYPLRLASIEMPPLVLYAQGDRAALSARSAVAIVGTRRATDTGRAIAARIAGDLVTAGASVVSGLAVGIDGAAHAAAIHARGTTVAVIGSGHGTLHPRAHVRLADSIVSTGGAIVSELGPDVAPSRGTFPRRNRLISGLADATVVVQAPARSGALITASWALEQGRPCFLVPGAIDDPAAAGCLAFLREFPDGARIVAGVPQLIDDLGLADHLAEPGVPGRAAVGLADLGRAAGRLGRELLRGRATVDELVAVTGWPVASVLAGLTILERRGLAVGVHGRYRPAGDLVLADPVPGQRPRHRP